MVHPERVIELCNVSKVFDGARGERVVAVDELSLEVPTGTTLCLIGTSGSGKTTTMKLINRLIEPSSGRVRLGGEDVAGVDVIVLRRRIGYVIQKGGLFPHMTVEANVGLLCRLEGWAPPDVSRRVAELLELVNLPAANFGKRYPRELSGGQRQRVGVARALALDPAYVLMDEPFGALDPITRRQIHEEFLALQARVAKTMVIVTHDMSEAFKLGDRIALMDGGKLVQIGREADFRERPVSDFVVEFLRSHVGEPAARTGS
jgi:osmoprotectant transport system ATP-binding protein